MIVMLFSSSDRIFDTMIDTKKIYVSMKTNFTIRKYKTSGTNVLYLSITGNSTRERICLDIEFDTKDWDGVKKRFHPTSQQNIDYNLILENYESKITAIKTQYRLSERVLTPELLKKELLNGLPRVKFTAFFHNMLEEEKVMMKIGSYKRHKSVLKKLNDYQPEVTFLDINLNWIDAYKRHLKKLKNENTTISANIASIKKFLGLAQRHGIKLSLNLDELKAGNTKGNRIALQPSELRSCLKFYSSEFCNPSYRLVLGYFLFSCMTGLRISDVQGIKRSQILDGQISFVSVKTNKSQTISLNQTAKQIVEFEPDLFEIKFADQHINDELKKIMKLIGVKKKVTFHVARHTFATSYLRAGGTVEKLQKLLAHSCIKQTMIYVHMLESEANEDLFLMDDLLKQNPLT